MNIQKSFAKDSKGSLYIVPTPIGNLDDITLRALNTLKSSSIIAAEDTRNTQKLLNHFEINSSLISYHEHNKQKRGQEILERLKKGEQVSLVSDAGMPAISDPGFELIQTSIQADHPVVVLPGANAALCALIGSGLSTKEFLFYGFLPRKKTEKKAELERLHPLKSTIIFYESPYRLKETLEVIFEQLGDRQITIARELTKRFEEYLRGKVSEVLNWFKENKPRGEYCLVVSGNEEYRTLENTLWWGHLSVIDHVNHYIKSEHLSNKDSIKRVATERQMAKREVYRMFHMSEND